MKKFLNMKKFKSLMGVVLSLCLVLGSLIVYNDKRQDAIASDTASNVPINGTMMQYFEWYLGNTGTLWNDVANNAKELSEAGFTALWLPPAYKADGQDNVGYGPYDLYDLGEFNQKGTVRTKYGTKAEYLNAINTLHNNNMQVYADIVLNHKAGADGVEQVSAVKCDSNNRDNTISGQYTIGSWTKFNFAGRGNTYSSFKWNASCFDGVDYDNNGNSKGVYRFADKNWDWHVATEYGNYDYLMYADVDFDNKYVTDELKKWGKWYVETANLDGFRLDAVKHIKYEFYKDWLASVRKDTGKELFTVGEYWSGNLYELENYISITEGACSLFDVPLHNHFHDASTYGGNYDMKYLFKDTLVSSNGAHAVSFVENHDTQYGQSLASPVESWFKPIAYTAILTREEGYPCVFYGDYYGTNDGKIKSYKTQIDKIMKARTDYAYGKQHDYLDDVDVIGWTREGDTIHNNSGLAAIITDGKGGSKSMYVGKSHAGEVWYDITGNRSDKVTISSNGYATFSVNGGSYSIYVNSNSEPETTTEPETTSYRDRVDVTVYYKTNNASEYMHYSTTSEAWTAAPGVQMSSAVDGYKKIVVSVPEGDSIIACFNDGKGNWDSNNSSNYTLSGSRVFTVANGKVTNKAPEEVTTTQEQTTTQEETTTFSDKVNVTVYYKTNNGTEYMHYKAGNDSWTTAPGVKMSSSNVSGYKVITVQVNNGDTIKACFNNGSGSWDNNYNMNYSLSGSNVYTVENGNVLKKAPESETTTQEETTTEEQTTTPDGIHMKIYYKTTNSSEYIHYQLNGGSWTTAPGKKMNDSEVAGYKVYVIDVADANSVVTACFNNGNGSWDNNGGKNYKINGANAVTIENGQIKYGVPSTDTSNKITIYYKTSWNKANIHYQKGNGVWTAVPGIAMTKSSYSGYYVTTIDLGTETTLTACFNNGSSWDSKNGSNYKFTSAGTYTVADGNIKVGTP